jgi:N-glycosylase/DNA lyase
MVETLCSILGKPVEYKGKTYYAFPEPEALAGADEGKLAPVRAGYRSAFILDAAKRVASGELKAQELREAKIEEARKSLCAVKGVGPKVADCVLLYGAGRMDAFPVDVWIKRILESCYGGEMPECFSIYGGLIQQYLFFYSRSALGKAKGI